MKKLLIIVFVITVFSCGNKKTILLPEISHTEITEIFDVSPAYLFYDETKPDSLELNRKNLISTTNWLVNVDKRLTLKQVFPKIKFLQDKKRNAKMHKNKAAKNYFTCNNTSIKNLGFIEFTNVHYNLKGCKPYKKDSLYVYNNNNFKPYRDPYIQKDSTLLEMPLFFDNDFFICTYGVILKKDQVKHYLNTLLQTRKEKQLKIITGFNKNISFQNYITYKTYIKSLESKAILISNNEYIY
jgi:hypothetical protein